MQQSGLNERITERLKELQEYRRQVSDPQKQIRTIVSRKNDEEVKNNLKIAEIERIHIDMYRSTSEERKRSENGSRNTEDCKKYERKK